MTAALEITDVTKDYHGLRPLRVRRLMVAEDESIAILGLDRGAAEVLVDLVTGAALPDTGDIHVFGRATSSIADAAEWLAMVDRFGLVTERAVLLEQLTVVQNLALPFSVEIEPPADPIRQRAEALASEVGLQPRSWTASVGQLEAVDIARVRLGRALAHDPALLLLEHFGAGLPPSDVTPLGVQIRAVAARRNAAILALTGDDTFARAVAMRILRHEPATGRLVDRIRPRWWSGSR